MLKSHGKTGGGIHHILTLPPASCAAWTVSVAAVLLISCGSPLSAGRQNTAAIARVYTPFTNENAKGYKKSFRKPHPAKTATFPTKTISSTGGCPHSIRSHRNARSRQVDRRASYETVASRVTNLKGRGVAMKPAQTLREIYEERKDLYEKFADHIIDVDEQSIEATAQELAKIARSD